MGGRSKGDGGAAERARQEAEATKKKYEAEKMEMDRVAAEQASGRKRAGRRSGLLSSVKLGTNGEQTLGATQV